MNSGKYWLIMPPFFLLGLLLFILLPKENWFLIFLLPMFFGVYIIGGITTIEKIKSNCI